MGKGVGEINLTRYSIIYIRDDFKNGLKQKNGIKQTGFKKETFKMSKMHFGKLPQATI